jgi:hypothetical protein
MATKLGRKPKQPDAPTPEQDAQWEARQRAQAAGYQCRFCGWPEAASGACVACFTKRVAFERPPGPRVFRDRNGRELPTEDGVPLCPRCGERDRVAVTPLNAHCGRCHDDVSSVEPRKNLPDF